MAEDEDDFDEEEDTAEEDSEPEEPVEELDAAPTDLPQCAGCCATWLLDQHMLQEVASGCMQHTAHGHRACAPDALLIHTHAAAWRTWCELRWWGSMSQAAQRLRPSCSGWR